MSNGKKGGVYTFTLKRKELLAVLAGLIVTYVMVFILGYTLGKESSPVVPVEQPVVQEETAPPPQIPPAPQVPEQPVAKTQKASPAPAPEAPSENQTPSQKAQASVEIPIKPVKRMEAKEPFRYFVQAGAFSKKSSAEALKKRLQSKGYKVQIRKIGGLYKVLIGPFMTQEEACKSKKRLIRDEKIYGYTVKY